mgnify:CR=1 FL=1
MKLALQEAVIAHEEPGVLAMLLPPFLLKRDRLGLDLNDSNQVTVVLPGSWAAAQGVLRRDKIVQANGEALVGGQQLADALADLREQDVEAVHLVLARRVATEAPPVPGLGKARAVGSASLRHRKEPEPEEPEEPPGPTDSQRRRNAGRVSDLLLELDDEKDGIDSLRDFEKFREAPMRYLVASFKKIREKYLSRNALDKEINQIESLSNKEFNKITSDLEELKKIDFNWINHDLLMIDYNTMLLKKDKSKIEDILDNKPVKSKYHAVTPKLTPFVTYLMFKSKNAIEVSFVS